MTNTTPALPIALPTLRTVTDLRVFLDKSPLLATPSYFFSPGALRAFNSHISNDLFVAPESDSDNFVGFFVTSEQYEDVRTGHKEPRYYTVRCVTLESRLENGKTVVVHDIGNVNEFQTYATLSAAKRAARAASQGEPLPN
jgi:hypothetical protein